jgi:hypothetical protein
MFENKVWGIIRGPVYNNRTGEWRRQFNRKLQNELRLAPVSRFISGQRIQWLGHVIRRNEEDTVRVLLEWMPTVKNPRERSRRDGLYSGRRSQKKRNTRVENNSS